MRTQALRADLMMLLTAIIWGSSFIAQRLGMDSIGPFLYTGLRFALVSIALLPLIVWLERRIEHRKPESINPGLLRGGLIMGLALTLGMNLQQVGLLFTSVTNSGFITGLYVIIVPLIGLFLGHKAGLCVFAKPGHLDADGAAAAVQDCGAKRQQPAHRHRRDEAHRIDRGQNDIATGKAAGHGISSGGHHRQRLAGEQRPVVVRLCRQHQLGRFRHHLRGVLHVGPSQDLLHELPISAHSP